MYKLLNCCRCTDNKKKFPRSYIRDLKDEFNDVDVLNNIITRSKKRDNILINNKPPLLKNELIYEQSYQTSLQSYQYDINIKMVREKRIEIFKDHIQT